MDTNASNSPLSLSETPQILTVVANAPDISPKLKHHCISRLFLYMQVDSFFLVFIV
jgi:hypothetical protein